MDHTDRSAPAVGEEWLDTVQEQAALLVQAEAVAEGHTFTDEQMRLVEIGILAGASQAIDSLFDLAGLRRSPPTQS